MWLCIVSFTVYSNDVDCDNPVTTIDINVCEGRKAEKAEQVLEKYFLTALETIKDQKSAYSSLEKSQVTWKNYKEDYCAAIYENWIEGTIRGYMQITCVLKLTKQRTHNIWGDYLTYMDSTPPRLPEPEE